MRDKQTARTETENLPERRDSNKSQNTLTEWEITTLARGKARGDAAYTSGVLIAYIILLIPILGVLYPITR